MRVRAFAKINLSLRVLGRRPDGYHELCTVFQSIALHDTLTIRRTRGPFRLTCDDPSCPVDTSNLVGRAARRVWRAAGKPGPLRNISVHIEKRIPMQAGLGGGSSDAAAAIRAFGRLWRVRDARQRAIAASLGADVPYFFEGGTVLGLERGDRLHPLPDVKPAWAVLILPAFGVSTSDAFGWLDRGPKRAAPHSSNDLEPPVAKRHPEIARIVRALRSTGAAHAAMTGSGSTVFGLFSRRNDAIEAAAALFSRDRRAIVTRTIARNAYRRLAASKPIG
jgi:4-diphosphocytidyl-2-C-methyl-D-erythritol kinase